jgi:hypothetical protein
METKVKEPRFRERKDFVRFLKEIDRTSEGTIKEIVGEDNYIDTPGFYREEAKHYNNNIEYFMEQNMGTSELARLKEYWETHIKD